MEQLRNKAAAPHSRAGGQTQYLCALDFNDPFPCLKCVPSTGPRPAPSTASKSNTSAGSAHWSSLPVMPHSWVSRLLKSRARISLAKKGNKKSRLTRSRGACFFFFFEQINIYFSVVKQLVEALLSVLLYILYLHCPHSVTKIK